MATQSSVKEKTRTRLQEPKKYNVIMHNDDYTTMEFVTMILMEIFRKSQAEANQLIHIVHITGKGIAGCYPYDIAVTKVSAALERARQAGFPFRMTIEEA